MIRSFAFHLLQNDNNNFHILKQQNINYFVTKDDSGQDFVVLQFGPKETVKLCFLFLLSYTNCKQLGQVIFVQHLLLELQTGSSRSPCHQCLSLSSSVSLFVNFSGNKLQNLKCSMINFPCFSQLLDVNVRCSTSFQISFISCASKVLLFKTNSQTVMKLAFWSKIQSLNEKK